MNKIFKYFTIYFAILLFSFISLEFALKIYSKYLKISFINDNRFSNIYRVYDQGEIFQSYKNFFLYKKNLDQKRYLSFYYDKKDKTFEKIWDYKFSTNNFGLMQKFNLEKNKKSILFLGDSFTEGQGAEPWIDNLGQEYNGYQVINGGIQGAGFRQFENLHNFLSQTLDIHKLVVIFISSDIRRKIELATNHKCLLNYNNCNSNNMMFGIPKGEEFDIKKFILEKINLKQKYDLKKKIIFFIRNLYIYQYSRSIINKYRLKNDQNIKINLKSIINLKKKYRDDIIFIRINDPGEIMFKKKSYETEIIDKFFKKKKLKYYFCDMDQNLSLFHDYDYHPNAKGYEILRKCVQNILDINFK